MGCCFLGGYEKGFLDDQFTQLQKLQDESIPEFVVKVVSLFFQDSEMLLNNFTSSLQQIIDYKQVDAHVHQFKGNSSSVYSRIFFVESVNI
ncbi:Histidine-containing phosphotransfer protein 5 [Camellia lanceoleosa]|uniref:Histidine-containing phosphotransfer protein 5 n=1 Tax=Camellia lanceoleosa TaxID=1840588 RepID=A0ACC0H023_9ERIC|nr:Histidine-containing phosphotransfer protein 5 [Camellia lanceoleosa]